MQEIELSVADYRHIDLTASAFDLRIALQPVLHDVDGESVSCAVVRMDDDYTSFVIANILISELKVTRVVVRLHNAGFAPLITSSGGIPFFSLSVESAALYQALTTDMKTLLLGDPASTSLASSMESTINADIDQTAVLAHLQHDNDRRLFAKKYPGPDMLRIRALIAKHALKQEVPEHMAGYFLERLSSVHGFKVDVDAKAEEKNMSSMNGIYTKFKDDAEAEKIGTARRASIALSLSRRQSQSDLKEHAERESLSRRASQADLTTHSPSHAAGRGSPVPFGGDAKSQ